MHNLADEGGALRLQSRDFWMDDMRRNWGARDDSVISVNPIDVVSDLEYQFCFYHFTDRDACGAP